MNIILQDSRTRQFVANTGSMLDWSELQTKARSFESGVEAFAFCRAKSLGDMNIVLSFEHSACQVEIPVRNAGRRI
jgi:hypothetical protein